MRILRVLSPIAPRFKSHSVATTNTELMLNAMVNQKLTVSEDFYPHSIGVFDVSPSAAL